MMSLDNNYSGCVAISVKRGSVVNWPEQLCTGVYMHKTLWGRWAGGGGRGWAGRLSQCKMTDQDIGYDNMEAQVRYKHRALVLAAVLTNDSFELLLGIRGTS